ncbi:MAG: transcriptional regulator [Betaproteobacteria bacterium]|nr:transcriptional regulator [Betaproteobacteria bacterium]
MNLLQLRVLREVVRQDFSLTEAAQVLHSSQSALSKQLTEAGEQVLPMLERLLLEAGNIARVAEHFRETDAGQLCIATTHTQARYVLPEIVVAFRREFPKVQLSLQQGSPKQIVDWLLRGQAQIGIATESLAQHEELVTFPYYQWTHAVVVPADHPLLRAPLDIESLSRWPLITYHSGFTGRQRIEEGFMRCAKKPNIVMSALDADVIKTYVACGLGVGIIASMAFDPIRDQGLRKIEAGQLFGPNVTVMAFRRGQILKRYAFRFAQLCSQTLSPDALRLQVESTQPTRPA